MHGEARGQGDQRAVLEHQQGRKERAAQRVGGRPGRGGGPELAGLRVAVAGPSQTTLAGPNVVYTVPVSNNGPSAATNVQIGDTLPAGVTLVSASADPARLPEPILCSRQSVN